MKLADGNLERKDAAAPVPPWKFDTSPRDSLLPVSPIPHQAGQVSPSHFLGNQHRQLLADHFCGGVSERLLGGAIHKEDGAVFIDRQEGVGGRLRHRPVKSLALRQRFLRSLAFGELSDLAARRFDHREQFAFRPSEFATEKFHDAEHAALDLNGKSKRAVQPRLYRKWRPREVRLLHDIIDPDHALVLPGATRHSDAASKPGAFAHIDEFRKRSAGSRPGLDALDLRRARTDLPEISDFPIELLTDGLQNTRQCI